MFMGSNSMTGAGSLSLDTQPVMDLRSLLSLSGRCGVRPAEAVGRHLGSDAGEGVPLQLNYLARLNLFCLACPKRPARRLIAWKFMLFFGGRSVS